jgi:hypothetical protein
VTGITGISIRVAKQEPNIWLLILEHGIRPLSSDKLIDIWTDDLCL